MGDQIKHDGNFKDPESKNKVVWRTNSSSVQMIDACVIWADGEKTELVKTKNTIEMKLRGFTLKGEVKLNTIHWSTGDTWHKMIDVKSSEAGVSIEGIRWLKQFVEDSEETTQSFVGRIVMKKTENYNTSLITFLQTIHPEFVNQPTVFVSHAWQNRIERLIDGLIHFDNKRKDKAFYWWDLFAVNQNIALNDLPPEDIAASLKEGLKYCNTTIGYIDPWHSPIYLQRSWCILEANESITSQSEFLLFMNQQDEQDFIENGLLKNPDDVLGLLSKININKSQARKPSDKEWILQYIYNTTGESELNNLITNHLRTWFLNTSLKFYSEKKYNGNKSEALFYKNLASMLTDHGQYVKSIEISKRALS